MWSMQHVLDCHFPSATNAGREPTICSEPDPADCMQLLQCGDAFPQVTVLFGVVSTVAATVQIRCA